MNNQKSISLAQLCKELSISTATGRNWLKLGKIFPERVIKGTPFFDKNYVSNLKQEIKNGKNKSLKSRRNKKYISGNKLYDSYLQKNSKNLKIIQSLLNTINNNKIKISSDLIMCLLADCAIQLISQISTNNEVPENILEYFQKKFSNTEYAFLINDLTNNIPCAIETINKNSELFNNKYIYVKNEDTLGLLYMSLNSLGKRKLTGSYYTPTIIVQKLCKQLFDTISLTENSTILDPCCGTGNFILQLPEKINYKNVYAVDIDETSIKLARINFALKYHTKDKNILYSNITRNDYLEHKFPQKFDIILGNPPWGFEFTENDKNKYRNKYISANNHSVEAYDLFTEKAISDLKQNGKLSFVIPEAILNVKSHTTVRSIIAEKNSVEYIEYLGNSFPKVQCPSIIMQIIHNNKKIDTKGMLIKNRNKEFTINQTRIVNPTCFSFNITDEEHSILDKIKNLKHCIKLKGQADFALGIVTGDNKKYITNKKTSDNEIILKGSDIEKYRITIPENYIKYEPENFQQTAKTELYRAKEKLFYRFISDKLIFAYDDKQRLSLNSCNILIPKIKSLSARYIMVILNSKVAQFYFEKSFNSLKVLRSHIEEIPIPIISKTEQKVFEQLATEFENEKNKERAEKIYNVIDKKIAKLFELDEYEYSII